MRRYTKVITTASQCFSKDVVDELREYLWISGSTDADLEEVEKYVYYVDGARKAVEKQVACEEMMTVAAGAYSCPLFSST